MKSLEEKQESLKDEGYRRQAREQVESRKKAVEARRVQSLEEEQESLKNKQVMQKASKESRLSPEEKQ